jgi:hypothetical protein
VSPEANWVVAPVGNNANIYIVCLSIHVNCSEENEVMLETLSLNIDTAIEEWFAHAYSISTSPPLASDDGVIPDDVRWLLPILVTPAYVFYVHPWVDCKDCSAAHH